MNTINNIFNGLKEACFTSYDFKKGDFSEIKPEYILTVLVAKAVANEKPYYVVKLEESLMNFQASCVPQVNQELIFAQEQDECGQERVDIAVYSEENHNGYLNIQKALFAIEVKGINPSKERFLKDVKRNLNYFELFDENTGRSIIKRSYNASIEKIEKLFFYEEFPIVKKKIEDKYYKWLKHNILEAEKKKINIKVYVETVLSNIYGRVERSDTSYGESQYDHLEDSYCYVGVVVEMKRSTKK